MSAFENSIEARRASAKHASYHLKRDKEKMVYENLGVTLIRASGAKPGDIVNVHYLVDGRNVPPVEGVYSERVARVGTEVRPIRIFVDNLEIKVRKLKGIGVIQKKA